jgi:hypothetical protein
MKHIGFKTLKWGLQEHGVDSNMFHWAFQCIYCHIDGLSTYINIYLFVYTSTHINIYNIYHHISICIYIYIYVTTYINIYNIDHHISTYITHIIIYHHISTYITYIIIYQHIYHIFHHISSYINMYNIYHHISTCLIVTSIKHIPKLGFSHVHGRFQQGESTGKMLFFLASRMTHI